MTPQRTGHNAARPYAEVTVRFNRRELIVPLFRCGVPDYRDGALVEVWEQFKDWRR